MYLFSILIISFITSCLSKSIIVVLGCYIQEIQQNRIITAINYANTLSEQPIWFLTGGVKNSLLSSMNEADVMKKEIIFSSNNLDIILDTKATNTAENFAYLKQWIIENDLIDNNNVVLVTSKFHENRAKKIFNGIFHNINIQKSWIFGDTECDYCWRDEHIHILNVDNDVKNALNKIKN